MDTAQMLLDREEMKARMRKIEAERDRLLRALEGLRFVGHHYLTSEDKAVPENRLAFREANNVIAEIKGPASREAPMPAKETLAALGGEVLEEGLPEFQKCGRCETPLLFADRWYTESKPGLRPFCRTCARQVPGDHSQFPFISPPGFLQEPLKGLDGKRYAPPPKSVTELIKRMNRELTIIRRQFKRGDIPHKAGPKGTNVFLTYKQMRRIKFLQFRMLGLVLDDVEIERLCAVEKAAIALMKVLDVPLIDREGTPIPAEQLRRAIAGKGGEEVG